MHGPKYVDKVINLTIELIAASKKETLNVLTVLLCFVLLW